MSNQDRLTHYVSDIKDTRDIARRMRLVSRIIGVEYSLAKARSIVNESAREKCAGATEALETVAALMRAAIVDGE